MLLKSMKHRFLKQKQYLSLYTADIEASFQHQAKKTNHRTNSALRSNPLSHMVAASSIFKCPTRSNPTYTLWKKHFSASSAPNTSASLVSALNVSKPSALSASPSGFKPTAHVPSAVCHCALGSCCSVGC
jgi:hypothetical protein